MKYTEQVAKFARAETYTTARTEVRYDSRVLAGSTLSVAADAAGLKAAVEAVDTFCRTAGVPRSVAWRLQVALDELLSNIVRHGSQRPAQVEVTPQADNQSVSLTISEEGPAFDPLANRPAPPSFGPLETRRAGGLGLLLIRHLVDEVSYRRDGQHNIVVLTCRLTGTSATVS